MRGAASATVKRISRKPDSPMTRNLKFFLGAAVIFYVIAALNEATGMYVLAAASLAVILACYALTRLLIRGVEPEVELERARVWAGEAMIVRARVRNAGAITRTGMSLGLHVDNDTVPAGSRDYRFLLPPLSPQSRTDLEFALACEVRGTHHVTGVELVASDPIGMYHRRKQFEKARSFLALPRIARAEGVSSWELISLEGQRSARMFRRAGGEIEGVRALAPGDDLRHVHWKVTAHTGEPMVKRYRRRREAEIAVWLDLWDDNHPEGGARSATEVAVSLAATLLHIFVHGDYLVSFAGQGISPDLSLPSRGAAYLDHALVALARSRPAPGLSFTEFCESQIRFSPRLVNVFAITPAAEAGLDDALAAPAHRGAQVAAFLASGATGDAEPSERLQAEAHQQMVERLRARGINATRVESFEAIPQALASVTAGAYS